MKNAEEGTIMFGKLVVVGAVFVLLFVNLITQFHPNFASPVQLKNMLLLLPRCFVVDGSG